MKKKVLFIDDKTSSLFIGKFMTEGLGHDVIAIDSGEAALEFISSPYITGIDIIFLDLMMPDTDGFKVLGLINSSKIQIPVIAQTGSGEDKIKRAKDLGVVACLVKPYNKEDVADMITKYAVTKKTTKHSCPNC